MAILEQDLREPATASATGLKRHKFSRQDYYSMGATGILGSERVELIEGEILEMAPIGNAHAALTHPLSVILETAFGPGFSARNQAPIVLGDAENPSEPQPDVAVVAGTWRDYVARKPQASDVKLVVKVADSSLNSDRKMKAVLYASAGIPDYWIINLADRTIEIYREPVGQAYTKKAVLKATDRVTPLHAPSCSIAVSDCLP